MRLARRMAGFVTGHAGLTRLTSLASVSFAASGPAQLGRCESCQPLRSLDSPPAADTAAQLPHRLVLAMLRDLGLG